MSYTPPPGGSVTLVFSSSAYSKPPGASVTLEFIQASGNTIYQTSLGDLSALGSVTMKWTQFASPSGADQLSIGSHSIDYHRLKPAGVDWSAFGTQYVYLGQQFVTGATVGDTSTVSRPHRVYKPGDYFAPDGGTLALDFNPSNRYPHGYTWPNGGSIDVAWDYANLTAAENGDGNMQAHLYVTMGDTSVFGTPTIIVPGFVQTAGFDTSAFGDPDVENLNRAIYPLTFETFVSPRQMVDYWTRTLYPNSMTPNAIGAHSITNFTKVVSPSGISALGIGSDSISIHGIFCDGIPEPYANIGTPSIQFLTQHAFTVGADYSAVGTPSISTNQNYIYPAGMDGVMNAPVVCRDGDFVVWDAGAIDAGAIGNATIAGGTTSGHNHYIYPDPIAGFVVGSHRIIPTTIYPKGTTLSGGYAKDFGTTWISNWIRYINGAGGNEYLRWGANRVSPSPQICQMQGFDQAYVWNDYGPIGPNEEPAAYVGHVTTRTISAAGTDFSAIGSPMTQFVVDQPWALDLLALGYSRVVGMTGGFPGHPIWGGLLVTDSGGSFYSTTASSVTVGDTSAIGTANIHF